VCGRVQLALRRLCQLVRCHVEVALMALRTNALPRRAPGKSAYLTGSTGGQQEQLGFSRQGSLFIETLKPQPQF